jgi:hypothetical protein
MHKQIAIKNAVSRDMTCVGRYVPTFRRNLLPTVRVAQLAMQGKSGMLCSEGRTVTETIHETMVTGCSYKGNLLTGKIIIV